MSGAGQDPPRTPAIERFRPRHHENPSRRDRAGRQWPAGSGCPRAMRRKPDLSFAIPSRDGSRLALLGPLGRRGAASRLRLAALEVFPQRRTQAVVQAALRVLLALRKRRGRVVGHGGSRIIAGAGSVQTPSRRGRRFIGLAGLHAGGCYGKECPLDNEPPAAPAPGPCCRSSVVEHFIGNEEVDSSILSGSTICL